MLGEKIAQKLGPRLGLAAEETETVAWLVRWHLLLSSTAFKLDIDDPQTIRDFVERVQSPERLKLLLVLTVADIRAVGPKVWNGWKAALLRELYHRALEVMSGGLTVEAPRRAHRRGAGRPRVRCSPTSPTAEFAAFTSRGYPFYWLSFDAETQARHARLMREAERSGAPLTVENRVDRGARGHRDHALYRRSSRPLLAHRRRARASRRQHRRRQDHDDVERHGARYASGCRTRAARAFDRPDKLAKLAVIFENVLTGDLKPHIELERPPAFPSRTSVFTVPPRVLIDNWRAARIPSSRSTAATGRACLWEVTRELTRLSLQVSSAKISTYGEKVVDVFYVKNLFGHKVEHEQKLAEIRTALEAVLAKGNRAAPAPAAPTRRARATAAAE